MSDDVKVVPFPVIERIGELLKPFGFTFRYYTLVNRAPVVIDTPVRWAEEVARRMMMQKNYRVDPWRVAETIVGDARVSTVFLGLDHRFGGEGPPVLFETMIFGGRLDEFQDRCCTWDEAEKMHAEAVRLVRGGHLRVIK
jgi:hypothetical protein